MDSSAARGGFAGVTPKSTGRPGYAPADLLKLYIYGYLNRVRSGRRLEAETHRNIEVIWLLRHLKPDFKTIADFRSDNRNAFRQVFRQFVLLCRELDLFGRELLAVDGTRIKAVNNKDRNFTRASLTKFIELADAKLEDYRQRLDQSDAGETKTGGSRVKNLAEKITAILDRRTRCQGMLAELDGFLTGILVGPHLIMPSEWLPHVWGGEEPVFESTEQAQEILGVIMGRYNEIAQSLDGHPEDLNPIF